MKTLIDKETPGTMQTSEEKLKSLQAQQARINAEIAALQEQGRKDALNKIHGLAVQFFLTKPDLLKLAERLPETRNGDDSTTIAKGRKPIGKVAPKYRDPATGDTWTGRGKAPRWIAGKNRDDFLID